MQMSVGVICKVMQRLFHIHTPGVLRDLQQQPAEVVELWTLQPSQRSGSSSRRSSDCALSSVHAVQDCSPGLRSLLVAVVLYQRLSEARWRSGGDVDILTSGSASKSDPCFRTSPQVQTPD
jgi:hypothetical protein